MNGSAAEVIGIISGKGGTGKTGACISMGQLLAYAGMSVLLVDLDTATLGMSHYLAPRMRPSAGGLLDEDPRPVPLEPGGESPGGPGSLSFLPLTADLERPETPGDALEAARRAPQFIRDARDLADVIIIDFQAGASEVLQQVAPLLTTVIIVTEADPVSIGAVSRLRRSLGRKLDVRLFGMVNKILPDELAYFSALTDLVPDIRFLPPLPFDSEVRKAFFRRGDPVDPAHLGPYGFALLRGLTAALPAAALALGTISTEPARESSEKLTETRDQAEDRLLDLLSRRRRRRLLTYSTILATLAVGAIAAPLLIAARQPALTYSVLGAIGAVLAAGLASFPLASRPQDQYEIDRQRDLLRLLDDRLVEYQLADITSGGTIRYQE